MRVWHNVAILNQIRPYVACSLIDDIMDAEVEYIITAVYQQNGGCRILSQ